MTRPQHSVSVTPDVFDQVNAYAQREKITIKEAFDRIVWFALGEPQPPKPAPTRPDKKVPPPRPKAAKPKRPTKAERAALQEALRQRLRGERAAAARAYLERYAAPIKRALQAGPRVQDFPPGAFCGVCAETCRGQEYREPIGRNGGLVNICERCRTEGGPLSAFRTA